MAAKVTRSPAPSLPPAWFWLAVLGSVVMLGIGGRGLFDHQGSAEAFGVPAAEPGSVVAWVAVAGLRDLMLGALGLTFALLKDRRALGITALLGGIIPVGDGTIVAVYGPKLLPFAAIHWGSAVACLVYAALLLRSQKASDNGI